jgi:alanine dehydrogenase
MEIAEKGIDAAIQADPALNRGVNTHAGEMRRLARLTNGKENQDGLE